MFEEQNTIFIFYIIKLVKLSQGGLVLWLLSLKTIESIVKPIVWQWDIVAQVENYM